MTQCVDRYKRKPWLVSPNFACVISPLESLNICSQPGIALEDYPFSDYADSEIGVASSTWWLLEKTGKARIMDDVLKLGVSAGTLFPELYPRYRRVDL